uniref:Uncharacterized protein n=1 Tax=Meloidogyne incognita TaxID=6306 RepID=A0A914KKN1_MELIC
MQHFRSGSDDGQRSSSHGSHKAQFTVPARSHAELTQSFCNGSLASSNATSQILRFDPSVFSNPH